jgi:hypothetical protein
VLKKSPAQDNTQFYLVYPQKENIPFQNIETPLQDLSIRHVRQDSQKEESLELLDPEIIQERNKACIEPVNIFTPNSKTRSAVLSGSRSVTPGELKREEEIQGLVTIVYLLTSDIMNPPKCSDSQKHLTPKEGEAEEALFEA